MQSLKYNRTEIPICMKDLSQAVTEAMNLSSVGEVVISIRGMFGKDVICKYCGKPSYYMVAPFNEIQK